MRASIADIVFQSEVRHLIDDSIPERRDDAIDMQDIAPNIIAHQCSSRYWRNKSEGNRPDSFVCRNPYDLKLSPDNTKHYLIPLLVNLTQEYKGVLLSDGAHMGMPFHSSSEGTNDYRKLVILLNCTGTHHIL